MAHDFFTEDPGIKLEMVSRTDSRIEFRLRILDPKKRCSNKHRENEAIQFDFDINNDNADDVASEMVQFKTFNNNLHNLTVNYLQYYTNIRYFVGKIWINFGGR